MVNEPFPALRMVSTVAQLGGVVALLWGPLYGVYQGLIEPLMPGHHFAESDGLQLVVGLLAGLIGVVALVVGMGADAWLKTQDEFRGSGFPT